MLVHLARGHWAVGAAHHVRDTSYGEEACRVTTPTAAVNLAALRNLSITLIRLLGLRKADRAGSRRTMRSTRRCRMVEGPVLREAERVLALHERTRGARAS